MNRVQLAPLSVISILVFLLVISSSQVSAETLRQYTLDEVTVTAHRNVQNHCRKHR